MNPHLIPAVSVLSFVTPLFAIALWLIHGRRKEEEEEEKGASATKRAAGFTASPPESRSHSGD
jgi:hypothetical protein